MQCGEPVSVNEDGHSIDESTTATITQLSDLKLFIIFLAQYYFNSKFYILLLKCFSLLQKKKKSTNIAYFSLTLPLQGKLTALFQIKELFCMFEREQVLPRSQRYEICQFCGLQTC